MLETLKKGSLLNIGLTMDKPHIWLPNIKRESDLWNWKSTFTKTPHRRERQFPLEEIVFLKKETIEIELGNKVIAELPINLIAICQAIEQSKYILELEDDWDEEGSEGYKKSTWKKAIEFIANYANWVLDETSIIIDTPKIFPGPEGSIEILWKKPKYRLLINIPEDPQSPASFYGDDFESEQIKGTFEPSKFNQGLILCLLSMT